MRLRRAAGLLVLLLAACATPGGIVGEPEGSGVHSLAAQLQQATARDDAPRTVFVGAALDGAEGVFDRDVEFLDRLFARQFGAGYRSLKLSNARLSEGQRGLPLALPPQLAKAFSSLREGHRAGDRYVVLLTSHGHKNLLALRQPALQRGQPMAWTSAQIAAVMDQLPAQAPVWLIVSACYSGSLIPALQQPNRLVMTAAHSERSSFGCGDKSPNTWFVKELGDALEAGGSWQAVWAATRGQVLKREQALKFLPSDPQWQVGSQWQPRLERPWQQF